MNKKFKRILGLGLCLASVGTLAACSAPAIADSDNLTLLKQEHAEYKDKNSKLELDVADLNSQILELENQLDSANKQNNEFVWELANLNSDYLTTTDLYNALMQTVIKDSNENVKELSISTYELFGREDGINKIKFAYTISPNVDKSYDNSFHSIEQYEGIINKTEFSQIEMLNQDTIIWNYDMNYNVNAYLNSSDFNITHPAVVNFQGNEYNVSNFSFNNSFKLIKVSDGFSAGFEIYSQSNDGYFDLSSMGYQEQGEYILAINLYYQLTNDEGNVVRSITDWVLVNVNIVGNE